MKYVQIIITVILALISIAAGFAKALKMPQEVAFFEEIGLGTSLVVAFGIVQIAGGILTLTPKFRNWGLIIIAAMFALSAIQIFMTGKLAFGLVSLVPAVLALILLKTKSIKPA